MEKWSSLHLPQGRNISIPDCAVLIDRCLPVNMTQGRTGTALCRWMSSSQHGARKGGHCSLETALTLPTRAWPCSTPGAGADGLQSMVSCARQGWGVLPMLGPRHFDFRVFIYGDFGLSKESGKVLLRVVKEVWPVEKRVREQVASQIYLTSLITFSTRDVLCVLLFLTVTGMVRGWDRRRTASSS